MSDVRIRPATAADVDEALEVERQVWARFHYETDGVPDWDYDPDLWVVGVRDGRIVATADGCRVRWDGRPEHLPPSWTDVLRNAPHAAASRWASALGTSILPSARGGRLGERMLAALAARAQMLNMHGMLAPVRPAARAQYPHLPVSTYARMRLADGRHVDPWLRAHERSGARIIGWAERSMDVSAPVEDWERWLGYPLPAEGRLLIDGAIGWLRLSDGIGRLSEDSVWVLHPLSAELRTVLHAGPAADVAATRARLKRSAER